MIKHILLLISVLFIASCSNTGQLVGDYNRDGVQDRLPEIKDLDLVSNGGNDITLSFYLDSNPLDNLSCRVNYGDGSPVQHFDCHVPSYTTRSFTLNHSLLSNKSSYNIRVFVSNGLTTVSSMVKFYTNQQVNIPEVYDFQYIEFNNSDRKSSLVKFNLTMHNPENYNCKMTFGDGNSSPQTPCSNGFIFNHTYDYFYNQEYSAVLIIKDGNKVVYKSFEKFLIQ